MSISDHVADICLYGNRKIGAGFIAQTTDGRIFGDGEPVPCQSMTEAVWTAIDIIRNKCGYMTGQARIFASGGECMAVVDINHVGYFGELNWGPAPVYTIAYKDIINA